MNPTPDAWTAGDAYEAYMGRWSRALAREFLAWLRPAPDGRWLEVGCGTGALTSAIVALARPTSVTACDPSAPFLEHARKIVPGPCTFSVLTDQLPRLDAGFDAIVSGLVLNFVPEPRAMLAAMRERARPGATLAAYVWSYAGGIELLKVFWEDAVALDPAAAAADESRRFAGWDGSMLEPLWQQAGLNDVQVTQLEIPTPFADFDDYWRPFLGRTGPAPAYVASLDPERRERLRARLESRLAGSGAPIELRASAFAVRGAAPPQ